ncbi:hypothetical protein GBA52_005540 [Prunus armeniaca]|nr:hypothetical protein GBA52_005540 [Prunus armeniaca]
MDLEEKKHETCQRGSSEIRMVVDACRPFDIREETNPEYYCRYITLSRTKVSPPIGPTSFPSVSSCGETPKKSVTSLIRLKYGSNEAAGKSKRAKNVYLWKALTIILVSLHQNQSLPPLLLILILFAAAATICHASNKWIRSSQL